MRTFILLLSLLTLARSARADSDVEVAVMVTGDAGLDLARPLEQSLLQAGRRIVPLPLPASEVTTVAQCLALENDACAREIVEKYAGTIAVVVLRAQKQTTKQVALTGYWFEGLREAVADQRVCDPCTKEALLGSAQELVSGLSRSHQRSVGRLRVTSSPSGALVHLDGQSIGVTPLDHDVAPGNHQITLTADSHEAETRTVAMRAGETTKIDVPLEPQRVDAPRRSLALPVALLVGGGVVAITGGALYAIDEDHDASAPDQIRDTAPYGVGMLAVGGAAIAVGAWLLIRSPSTASSSSSPMAFATGESAYVGWTGTF